MFINKFWINLILCILMQINYLWAGGHREHVHIKLHMPKIFQKHTHVRTVTKHHFHPKKITKVHTATINPLAIFPVITPAAIPHGYPPAIAHTYPASIPYSYPHHSYPATISHGYTSAAHPYTIAAHPPGWDMDSAHALSIKKNKYVPPPLPPQPPPSLSADSIDWSNFSKEKFHNVHPQLTRFNEQFLFKSNGDSSSDYEDSMEYLSPIKSMRHPTSIGGISNGYSLKNPNWLQQSYSSKEFNNWQPLLHSSSDHDNFLRDTRSNSAIHLSNMKNPITNFGISSSGLNNYDLFNRETSAVLPSSTSIGYADYNRNKKKNKRSKKKQKLNQMLPGTRIKIL